MIIGLIFLMEYRNCRYFIPTHRGLVVCEYNSNLNVFWDRLQTFVSALGSIAVHRTSTECRLLPDKTHFPAGDTDRPNVTKLFWRECFYDNMNLWPVARPTTDQSPDTGQIVPITNTDVWPVAQQTPILTDNWCQVNTSEGLFAEGSGVKMLL